MDPVLKQRIEELINSSPVFLFMKGTPQMPQCGFSAQVIEILNEQNIKFKSFNVFEDESIRQGVKEYANWPTIPQIYVKGKFIGGCDILTDLAQSGELKKLI
ncbi:Grx4 family monothiol glutaredoxin [Candidatus Woesearchaeota archaeon]|nr:Grx4 family monothiol glutaredoxin [Candidatus Woesearchaeota archaeon]